MFRRSNDRGHKLRFKCYGPCRITAAYSPLVYSFVSIRVGKTDRIHCARLFKYRVSFLGTAVPEAMLKLDEAIEARYEVAECIKDAGQASHVSLFRFIGKGTPTNETGRANRSLKYMPIFLKWCSTFWQLPRRKHVSLPRSNVSLTLHDHCYSK